MTVSGEEISYPAPAPHVAAFLARVVDAAKDPRVSDGALTNLIYGKENPILDQTILPDSGVVTREAFANPLYEVMTDLLYRKRLAVGVNAPAGSEFTLTVTKAAEQLGVHPSAVRQAIAAGRIEAKKMGHIHFLRPADVEAFKPARRGPAARSQLELRIGSAPGESFRVQVDGGKLDETARKGKVIEGVIERFDRVALLSGGEDKYRFFELEPSDTEEELKFKDFFVRGRFRIARKVNNAEAARAEWKKFGAARAVAR